MLTLLFQSGLRLLCSELGHQGLRIQEVLQDYESAFGGLMGYEFLKKIAL